MMSKRSVMLLAVLILGAAASGTNAYAGSVLAFDPAYAQADTSGARPDTVLAPPDSASAPAVTPAPAAAPAVAPTTTAPPPAATPPPAAAPAAATPAKAPSKLSEKLYYGGTVTLSFGSTTQIGIFPMVAYKVTPKLSAGVEAGYEYVDYSEGSTHNYGGSVFGRFRVGRNLYAHAEYQLINYEIFDKLGRSSREWVPALLLGGGFVKPLNQRTAVYAEVLFDVLQDQNSPYSDWEPVVNVGVSVGF